MRNSLLALACLASLLLPQTAFAGGGMNCGFGDWPPGFGNLKTSPDSRETIRVFPTYAVLNADGKSVRIPLRAWVFENERDRGRRYAVKKLAEHLDIEESSAERAVFERRMYDFMVDNESGKKVYAHLSGKGVETQATLVGESGRDGQVTRVIELPYDPPKKQKKRVIKLSVSFNSDHAPDRTIEIPVLDAEGLTIISDIDDTTKVTNVIDRKAMLENTFKREFTDVPGMAKLYQKWSLANVAFHYVSASPWTLYKDLSAFSDAKGFPSGVYHLRVLRPSDLKSVSSFVRDSRSHKIDAIEGLIGDFPQRTFILVGDTGEKDPEIYAELAKRFPKRIAKVYLRRVDGADNSDKRFTEAFEGVPTEKWSVFANPSEL